MQSLPSSYASYYPRTIQLAQVTTPDAIFEFAYDSDTHRVVFNKYNILTNTDTFHYFTQHDITPRDALDIIGYTNYQISNVINCYGDIINTDNYIDTPFYNSNPVQFTIYNNTYLSDNF